MFVVPAGNSPKIADGIAVVEILVRLLRLLFSHEQPLKEQSDLSLHVCSGSIFTLLRNILAVHQGPGLQSFLKVKVTLTFAS